jgi:hypothetical protein
MSASIENYRDLINFVNDATRLKMFADSDPVRMYGGELHVDHVVSQVPGQMELPVSSHQRSDYDWAIRGERYL